MICTLRLIITTPAEVLFDGKDIVSVRATDATGSLGILANHVDLITVLDDSVVRWRDMSKTVHYCAVSRGVLLVSDGEVVRIACREGLVSDDLAHLNSRVSEYRALVKDTDRRETTRQMRLHTQTMRHIVGYLQNSSGPVSGQQSGSFDLPAQD